MTADLLPGQTEAPSAEAERIERARRFVRLRDAQRLHRVIREAHQPPIPPVDWPAMRRRQAAWAIQAAQYIRGERPRLPTLQELPR